MEGPERAFLEDPLYVYIALGFAELVLAVIWHETRARRWSSALVVPPLLAVAVWALATWAVTDREQIIRATERIARDAEAGSVAAAEEFLDDDYRGFGESKAGLLEAGRATLKAYPIKKVGFTRVEVTVEDTEATMHLSTIITLVEGKVGLAWDVRWVKRPAGWRIVSADEPTSKVEL
ncbi:MAG: hypothetical protein MUP47_03790 [Phycisphaerae bacterium]|nr:hypothetical protein [Phycisphaerae bacterium]